jgi:hypothetical protein
MKHLSYANGRPSTTDAVARALMDYARAIATRNVFDIVDIRVIDPAGTPRAAEGLGGPHSGSASRKTATRTHFPAPDQQTPEE